MAAAYQLTQQELEATKKAFSFYDKDNSGKIDAKEFKGLCEDLKENLTDAERAATLKKLDTNGNGVISWSEFIVWWCEA